MMRVNGPLLFSSAAMLGDFAQMPDTERLSSRPTDAKSETNTNASPPAQRVRSRLAAGTKPPSKKSTGEETLALQIRSLRLREPIREYRFHSTRKWRFDFAWPELKFAVEVEGMGGRHQTHSGFKGDLEKYHAAFMQFWIVYRCTSAMVKSGLAIEAIEHFMKARAPQWPT